MKFNLLILSLGIFLFSCGESKKEGSEATTDNIISGKIQNGEGKTLYLEGFTMNGTERLDSAVIGKDGSFELKAPAKTDFFRIGFTTNNFILLSLDSLDKKVTINANADSLGTKYTVDGSQFSRDILDFVNEQTPYTVNKMNLVNEYNTTDQKDTSLLGLLQRSMMRLDQAFGTYILNFIDTHPKSPATFLTLQYLDPMGQLDVIKKVEKAIAASMYNSPLHVDILNKIGQLDSQKQISDAQLIEQERMMSHLQIGNAAPEINLPSVNGGNLSLSSMKGKVVLIDFWASWCGPCRKENPNVVRLYNQYKDKGFTVYSVSLDKDKTKWVEAIKKDGLVWPNHVSDLKYWQSVAAQAYGVTSIPFTVLIDKNGKIIDKNLRGAQLEAKLKEILGS